jgi:predicted transposase YbfD/YdcC
MLVKDNQPELHRQLQAWFERPDRWRYLDCRTARTVNKGHGRLEQRTITVSAACRYLDWPGLAQVMCFDTHVVNTKTQVVSDQRCFAITSLSPQQASAAQLLDLRRQHWAIENRLHYPRDVWFREDASRIRTGQAPKVMATIRNGILNLLRGFGYHSLKKARELFRTSPQRAFGLLELPVDFLLE